jgi:2-polyprenyl-3-methyl-5-hydroxy-6-metoxy-1,4-benzoquinol methylase
MEFERIADQKRLHFIITALRSYIPENGSVLDVGCGNGIITRSVGAAGFNVFGIDVSEKTIQQARAINTLPNVQFDVKSAEELVAGGKQYDGVICSEVLEHLSQPAALLKVLFQSLSDKGILIVTVPNGKGPRETLVTRPVQHLSKRNNWLWKALQRLKRSLGYKGTTVQSSAEDLTHIQFFTKKTLEELARQNQFKIVRFGKTNFISDVFPFSFFSNRIKSLQKLDCAVADILPYYFTGGFVSVWQKIKN